MPTLTEAACKNASCPPDLKRRRLTDGGGLYLEVAPNGSKRWFWKFYPDGKESRLALGSYPEVTLKTARVARDAARMARQAGVNPVQARKAEKIASSTSNANTFEAVAREFHKLQADTWSPSHAAKWLRSSEKHLFPHLGTLPLDSIKAPALLAVLKKAESKGILSTAQDLLSQAGQVFRFGVQSGRCERNPAADLRGALKPHIAENFAAVTDPVKAGELLRAIDGYTGQPTTRAALQLSALIFQRPGNVRAMEWAWIDLDAALLTIPAAAMKRTAHGKLNGRPHLVPLARQSLALLTALKPLTGHGVYVFPSARTGERPMSDGTLNAALRRLDFSGDEHVAHGFRAMARTMMAEIIHGIDPEVVEAQLAHGKSGPLGSAYDRAEYMEQRRLMMQTWADYLDQLRAGAKVLAFKAA
ncbi:tyrosine-type recombinase/integrase [Paucibacter sp. M5-1]|uniref:tyrosine-type recombinase/integrase n=1 Tax=Paucibacter sp. M5-1 TaxID=3015998 RepID=UPI0022B86FE4|nr:site-specific integrase [Paucibacter sp. M5-1]MCZ7883801.1 integrase arm-type DNA-binding domain-containing protein [Paucibacter sp. M5-1]